MLLSKTSQYAIQALIYLAAQEGQVPMLNRNIASYLKVPSAYLAKIMQDLARSGLLYSYRGRLGGFCLREGAEHTDLMTVLSLTEGPSFTDECVLGLKVCSDETACPMHARWTPIKEQIIAMCHEQTLSTLAEALKTGKYRIADLPGALWNTPYTTASAT
jgi:Rrf2 family protein